MNLDRKGRTRNKVGFRCQKQEKCASWGAAFVLAKVGVGGSNPLARSRIAQLKPEFSSAIKSAFVLPCRLLVGGGSVSEEVVGKTPDRVAQRRRCATAQNRCHGGIARSEEALMKRHPRPLQGASNRGIGGLRCRLSFTSAHSAVSLVYQRHFGRAREEDGSEGCGERVRPSATRCLRSPSRRISAAAVDRHEIVRSLADLRRQHLVLPGATFLPSTLRDSLEGYVRAI